MNSPIEDDNKFKKALADLKGYHNLLKLAPLAKFYELAIRSSGFPEKVATKSVEQKSRAVLDFIGMSIHSALMTECLIELLIQKGIITQEEMDACMTQKTDETIARKKELHERYFQTILSIGV